MVLITVPKPPASAMDPLRPANALLLAQIMHLQEAELRLPLKYQTNIYAHAIRTEGEAAEYIRSVTEAIHQAHADAAARRAKKAVARRPVFEIAAAAEQQPRSRRKAAPKKKRKAGVRSKPKKQRRKK